MTSFIMILVVVVVASAIAFTYVILHNRKYQNLQFSEEKLDKIKAEIEVKEQELTHLEDCRDEYNRAQNFKKNHPDSAQEIKGFAKELKDFESKMIEIRDQRDQLLEEIKDLNVKKEALAGLERELTSGEIQKKELEVQNEKLTGENKTLTTDKENLEKEISERKETNRGLTEDKNKLNTELIKIEKERQSAEKWLSDNRDKLSHMDKLDAEIEEKEAQLKSLNERLVQIEKNIEVMLKNIEKGIDHLNKMNLSGVQRLRETAFAALKEPVFSISKNTSVSDQENEALASVAQHFKNTGFEVPPRLLMAFHTSLKTSDMSSLTVMAGVSGTGKSALPKLYSEAMGICFQPLAVEPRWDSPKDLLGFFNYVTNRYEPTLLARALFQFQGGWDDKGGFRPDSDMAEYMFMPMLDEMNLARIEYYFSEFLSKLEMRRLEPVLTQKNCRAIALEVFQGFDGVVDGKKVHEDPIRLFANDNTLFVGTMNEDETTQSLSDKVIDRANVLYFGKPDKLQPKTPKIPDSTVKVGNLSKSRWNSWKRDIDEGELDFVSTTLAKLNGVLAEFHRPFAHRTFQAMLSYVANYPEVAGKTKADIYRMALADQIGMRIMPKLRGLDLSQHVGTFDGIGKIIKDNLKDTCLSSAFNDACDRRKNRTGFFEWSGFDWEKEN